MAYDKEITIKVKEEGVDELNTKITKLNKNLDQVETESKKAGEGIENVTKNGGAIAILDQLTGGLATRFRDAFEATKLFNFSLKGTKTALIATGIGAFVVALGLIVAYWDEIVEFIGGANKKLQEQIDLNNKNITNLSFELKLLESKEKILIAEGKSTKEVKEQKEKLLNLLILENDLLLQGLQTQILKEQSQAKELTFGEKALNLLRLGQGQPIKIISEITEEEKTRIDEITKAIQDGKLKAEELKLALIELNKPTEEEKDKEKENNKERKKVVGIETSLANDQELSLAKLLADEKVRIDRQAQDSIARYREEIRQEDAAEAIALEESVKDAKANIANQTLSLLSEIAGKGSKVGKALAVAQTTLSGIEGVQNAFTTASKSPITTVFPAYPFIQAGLAGAFSALQVKKILSTDASGKSGGGGGSGVGGGGGTSAPSFNLVAGTGSNQIAEGLQGQSQPIEAYVVSSNVTTSQELDRKIISGASLG